MTYQLFLEADGVAVCYSLEGVGRRWVVLVGGNGHQLIDWDDGLISALADRGFSVLRFDNRDSGQSTHWSVDPPRPLDVWQGSAYAPYSLTDMADDLAELLSHLGVARCTVVGHSMGGMIAQELAINHPALAAGLVLISTTTGASTVGQSTPEVQAVLAGLAPPVPGSAVDRIVARTLMYSSTELIEVDEVRAQLERRLGRYDDSDGVVAKYKAGMARQLAAVLSARDRSALLPEVDVPVVLFHGADDPLIDRSGSEALARLLPQARLADPLPGMRHDIPRQLWPALIEAIEEVATDEVHPA